MMRQRDTHKNIEEVKEEVQSYGKSNKMLKKAKQGHFKLTQLRTMVPEKYLQQTNNEERLNLCLLNDYLNGYSFKLSRGNAFDPSEIKIDFSNFSTIKKGISNNTFNPYFNLFNMKNKPSYSTSAGGGQGATITEGSPRSGEKLSQKQRDE